MTVKDKTILITGGNSGIGLATARLLLENGARVAITGRDQAKLDAAVLELGGDVLAIKADVNNLAEIDQVVSVIKERFGSLDVVFANAGISGPTPLGGTTLEAFEAILRTNLTSVFFTVQGVLPLLKEGSSVILNGSVMRELGSAGSSAYSASKGAITSMAKVFASELAPKGIRVNTVIPGATRTPIWTRGARAGATVDATEKAIAPRIPMGRFAEADELAQAVMFLASSASSGMTAAEIVVDGGNTGAPWGIPLFRG
ncbi:NAD(P)-dependent dehydrogenase (short-subunit alcohol dehydrogenase family) [Pseudomonas sp. JUb42]|jgi:NAD(P)-dependent dehydrogenase (short-subunit alcohol dehydrogenase family)|uniref:SDR family NAD(P)-dependent oxidoreductase n=1 Tax=Pseudomonas sp. JUb42 TaxID=2940611 RepID=UPI002167C6DD|nr:SDR family oxidoreductase [Pseudomonas sp. JUb42]MCS3468574.1 NAD(P)-dependent dehydrogenase (short-subunit alcohol dehydrogenase family) [Pseudomonas sp. JUb42]